MLEIDLLKHANILYVEDEIEVASLVINELEILCTNI